MKPQAFIEAAACYRRRSGWAVLGPIGCGALLMPAYLPFADALASAVQPRFGEPVADVFRVLPLALLLIVSFGLAIPLSRRVERKFAVPCPHCNRALAPHSLIVVASKHCPHCGSRVLEDGD